MAVRAFVSIPVPNAAGLEPFARDLRMVRGVRVPPLDGMHITLCFVGEVDERRIDDIEAAVASAVSGIGPGRVTVAGSGAFPRGRDPRVVWAGVRSELPPAAMADGVSRNLAAAGIPFDAKPFKPHITVARTQRGAWLDPLLRKYSGTEFATFVCSSVKVMGSELGPRGAVHTVLRSVEL